VNVVAGLVGSICAPRTGQVMFLADRTHGWDARGVVARRTASKKASIG